MNDSMTQELLEAIYRAEEESARTCEEFGREGQLRYQIGVATRCTIATHDGNRSSAKES